MTPDEPKTEQLRAIFSERAEDEAERADDAEGEPERRTHARRSDKAAYLKEKLDERAASEAEAERD
jgi:hypothetical protein